MAAAGQHFVGLRRSPGARGVHGDRAGLSSGGVVVLPPTTTDDYFLVNPFASYRRKVRGHHLTLQLNVNNVLGLHSDQGNSYTWPRYTDPRQFVWTATLDW